MLEQVGADGSASVRFVKCSILERLWVRLGSCIDRNEASSSCSSGRCFGVLILVSDPIGTRLGSPALENGHSPTLEAMAQLSCPRSDQISSVGQLSQRLLQDLAGADLLLFILPDGQRWNEVLTSSAADEEEIFLADLHADLLLGVVELAHATAFGESGEGELRWMGLGKVHHIQPANCGRRVVCGLRVLGV